MEYRQLGKAGLRISTIGLGTNRFGTPAVGQDVVNNMIDAAADLGVNFIDTADVYTDGQSETTLGVALKGRWDKFVLATKVFHKVGSGTNDQGVSRYHIQNGLEASLRRLQSDHIDLYYLHRWDINTPIEESLRTLDDLISAGKVRYIGASNYAAWQLAQANLLAEMHNWTSFVALQSQYHLLARDVEKEVLPYCAAQGVGFIPYFPLAGGFLTGKYRRGEPAPAGSRGETSPYVQGYLKESNFDILEKLQTWVDARERSLSELAEAWLLAQPAVASVISGATKLEQIQANVKAADWKLTSEEVAEVTNILNGE